MRRRGAIAFGISLGLGTTGCGSAVHVGSGPTVHPQDLSSALLQRLPPGVRVVRLATSETLTEDPAIPIIYIVLRDNAAASPEQLVIKTMLGLRDKGVTLGTLDSGWEEFQGLVPKYLGVGSIALGQYLAFLRDGESQLQGVKTALSGIPQDAGCCVVLRIEGSGSSPQ
jgi:hypothetical protein